MSFNERAPNPYATAATRYPSFVRLKASISLPPHYLSGKVAITANKEASSGFLRSL
jgi:hypothetical protein